MQDYIYEELTLAELSDRFLHNSDFETPMIYEMGSLDIEVETQDAQGNLVYKPIETFIVKPSVNEYYTDGILKGTSNHRIIENGKEIHLKDHHDFIKQSGHMPVVDIEVEDLHSYNANGRLNHNTTSGGKALAFHSSVRLRLVSLGQIKIKDKSIDEIVGIKTRVKVIKNRLGPPLKSVDYDIYFNSGIDDWGSWLIILKEHSIITGTAAGYTIRLNNKMNIIYPSTGEVIDADVFKFKGKEFGSILLANPKLKEYIYSLLSDKLIMKYKVNEDFGVDDITTSSDDFISEES